MVARRRRCSFARQQARLLVADPKSVPARRRADNLLDSAYFAFAYLIADRIAQEYSGNAIGFGGDAALRQAAGAECAPSPGLGWVDQAAAAGESSVVSSSAK